MDELQRKMEELEVAIKANSESSNTRMQNVNQMITNILEVMSQCMSKHRVVEDALRQAQQGNLELVKNNAELIKEIKVLRQRCTELSKEVKHCVELLANCHGITIENNQK